MFPILMAKIGGGGTFGVFLAMAVGALLFVCFYAPEFKGHSLEEIRAYWDNGGRWPVGKLNNAHIREQLAD